MIRSLRPGEAIPEGTPRRYPNSNGYMRLRWHVGPSMYVEAYEHRIIDGVVTEAEHVHHINHDPTDNRPENLRHMSAEEHRQQHASELPAICADLYQSGWNTVEIAEDFGINPGTVSRALARAGVKARPANDRRIIPVDEAEVRRLYDLGYPPDRIADLIGSRRHVVRCRMAQMGLPPRPLGYRTPRHLLDAQRESQRRTGMDALFGDAS